LVKAVCELPRHSCLRHAASRARIRQPVWVSVLAIAAFGRVRWECRNGYYDSPGAEGCYVRGSWFNLFARAADRVREHEPGEDLS